VQVEEDLAKHTLEVDEKVNDLTLERKTEQLAASTRRR